MTQGCPLCERLDWEHEPWCPWAPAIAKLLNAGTDLEPFGATNPAMVVVPFDAARAVAACHEALVTELRACRLAGQWQPVADQLYTAACDGRPDRLDAAKRAYRRTRNTTNEGADT